MDGLCTRAVEAAHMTTPVESTVASFCDLLHSSLVSPSTAQQLAPVQSRRWTVAGASRSAMCAYFAIVGTEIGWLFKIHEVPDRWELMCWVLRFQVAGFSSMGCTVAAFVGVHDSGCAVETVLQEVSHYTEAGQSHPACSHSAGPRHPMTLALLLHLWCDCL